MSPTEIIDSKIIDFNAIEKFVGELKQNGQKIVFTNGCFDVLHIGHIQYLAEAKKLGDKLIIGLNSDASVKRLKGESRPINPQVARAKTLAALFFVDAIILFEEDTPENLIRKVSPDVLVKGGDYTLDTIVGAGFVTANGGLVTTLPLVDGFSSTKIIKKLL